MANGIIEYNAEGKPKCELCGQFHSRVLSHVRQKHFMTAREYKQMFGFDLIKGIISAESRDKSRQAVLNNFDTVVQQNLIKKGTRSRFKKGSEGRTQEQVSPQTRIMLAERAKNSMTAETRRLRGREIGLSGKGNKKRWSKENDGRTEVPQTQS